MVGSVRSAWPVLGSGSVGHAVGGWWVFNVAIGEIFVVLFVCLVVFGPERLLGVARRAGRLNGQLRLLTQGVLGQPRQELARPGVGSLHAQARLREPPRREVDAGLAASDPRWGAGRERLRWR
jgi:Sec-independent protein translocase protein TatA